MRGIEAVKTFTDRCLQAVVVLLFILIIVAAFLQVFSRFVLGKAFYWTDELSRYGLVWLTFSAAALGFGRNAHIAIDVFTSIFPQTLRRIIENIHLLLIGLMGGFLYYGGADLAEKTLTQFSPALRLSMGYVYSALPFFGAVTALFSALQLASNLLGGEPETAAKLAKEAAQ